jgi:flagellar basal-body rod protein FlgB
MDVFSSAFGIHERALGVRSQRMEVLARNIANADTPNYKAQDVDRVFDGHQRKALCRSARSTRQRHALSHPLQQFI